MDPRLVYVKTPMGDKAVSQSTGVVERNLRMVLVQVDGKLNIAELSLKIGNVQLVETALERLQEGGFIKPGEDGFSDWEADRQLGEVPQLSGLSEFSTFGPKPVSSLESTQKSSVIRNFSSFGKPVFPTTSRMENEPVQPEVGRESPILPSSSERQFSLLKYLGGGGVVLAALLLGLASFYPYARHISALEISVSNFLQTPVHIGSLGMELSPWPKLVLSNVRLGDADDSRIEVIRLGSPIALLMSGPYHLSTVEVSGAVISANRLVDLPFFKMDSRLSGSEISIGEISFVQSQVAVRDLVLRDISGKIYFKPDGSVGKSTFWTVDRSIQFTATPAPSGIALDIDGRGWKPAGALITFDSLQAKGLLQKDRLLIRNLDTTFLGGILKGNWLLDWRQGLVVAGDATLSRLDCSKVNAAFAPLLKMDGDLGGVLRLRAGGSNWETMWESLEATLDAEVTRGIFYGIDLGAVARGAGSNVRSGSTKFDRLRTTLVISRPQVSGRDIQINAGMMSASGQFVATHGREVAANLTVAIQGSASTLRIPVRISGSLSELIAVGGK